MRCRGSDEGLGGGFQFRCEIRIWLQEYSIASIIATSDLVSRYLFPYYPWMKNEREIEMDTHCGFSLPGH